MDYRLDYVPVPVILFHILERLVFLLPELPKEKVDQDRYDQNCEELSRLVHLYTLINGQD